MKEFLAFNNTKPTYPIKKCVKILQASVYWEGGFLKIFFFIFFASVFENRKKVSCHTIKDILPKKIL